MKFLPMFALLLITQISYAEEIGRYQAVEITKSASATADEVFILDTKEGHMWVWSEYPTIPNLQKGGRSLIYMGKVKPGEKLGDIIEKQDF